MEEIIILLMITLLLSLIVVDSASDLKENQKLSKMDRGP